MDNGRAQTAPDSKDLNYIRCSSAINQLITHYKPSLRGLKHRMDDVEMKEAHFIASVCPNCQM
jgi:Fe-S oxidoreductase